MKDSTRPANLKTEIRPSPGKGRGVFALKAIRKGEVIEVAPTIKIPKEDASFLRASFLVDYLFADDTDDEADLLALGHASMYNHSFEPSAEWVTGKGLMIVRAVTAIKAGQEITVNYGWEDEDFQAKGMMK